MSKTTRIATSGAAETPADPSDAPQVASAVSPPRPTEGEQVLMGALSITCSEGIYRWREYRYERLADALACALRVVTR